MSAPEDDVQNKLCSLPGTKLRQLSLLKNIKRCLKKPELVLGQTSRVNLITGVQRV